MSAALQSLRILDLTQGIAGPYCTKLFAAGGADVIKIERPGAGDPARRLGPFPNDEPHHEKGGMFLSLNTGKRSVSLNLSRSNSSRDNLRDNRSSSINSDLSSDSTNTRSSGSSTGLYGLERWTPSRASRARTRLEEPERPETPETAAGGAGAWLS